MTAMVSNQTQIQPSSSAKLVGIFKAIAPRSFEKTFDGIPVEQVNQAMKICIDGLSKDQINIGLSMVRDNGFCPDPAMFRKWCLGITGFGTEQQRATDSFKGKHAALANIVKWLNSNKHQITNAEKEAYDRCCEMFNAIRWTNNVERAQYYAYEAFKEGYVEVVREFVEQSMPQAVWINPPSIGSGFTVVDPDDEVDNRTSEQIAEDKAEVQKHLEHLRSLIKRPTQKTGATHD